VQLGTAVAVVGAQASASFTVTDRTLIGQLGANARSELAMAVRILGASKPAPLLRTDDISVTVTYRLP
jgi:hypothetical protein